MIMQRHPLFVYFSRLSIFAICVCFVFLFAALGVPKDFLSENLPYYVVMFYCFTALSYVALYLLPRRRGANFLHVFLICKVVKFVVYISVLLLSFLFGAETNAKFALTYFVLFVLFLVFDTVTTNRLAKDDAKRVAEEKKNQEKPNDNE